MYTRLAREGLSNYLQNSITDILGVENDKVEQPPPNDNTPRRCKMCVIASHGKGHKSAKDSMGKVKSRCAKCQQPVCRKQTITVCESCTQTQDITFLTLLDTCFVSKWQLCAVFEGHYFWKKSIYPVVWKKLRFYCPLLYP